jgi:hypothetical protein
MYSLERILPARTVDAVCKASPPSSEFEVGLEMRKHVHHVHHLVIQCCSALDGVEAYVLDTTSACRRRRVRAGLRLRWRKDPGVGLGSWERYHPDVKRPKVPGDEHDPKSSMMRAGWVTVGTDGAIEMMRFTRATLLDSLRTP